MYILILTPLFDLWVQLMLQAVLTVSYITICCVFLHRVGVLQKALVRFAEWRFSKILLNGVPVSISKLEVDVFTNKVWVTDVIIHSPDRDKWKWDSPLMARFGKVYLHCSFLSLLDPVAAWAGYKWRDLYAISVSDVQVFVEKRRNVYNFHLLDESLDLPKPEEIMKGLGYGEATTKSGSGGDAGVTGSAGNSGNTSGGGGGGGATIAASTSNIHTNTPAGNKQTHESIVTCTPAGVIVANKSSSPTSGTGGSPSKRLEMIVSGDASSADGGSGSRDLTKSNSSAAVDGLIGSVDRSLPTTTDGVLPTQSSQTTGDTAVLESTSMDGGLSHTYVPHPTYDDDQDGDAAAAKRANEIVTSMLKTVSKLGKAANEGGKEGLERAFKYQRDGFVHKLKQFQANVGKTDTVGEAAFGNVRGVGASGGGGLESPNSAEHLLHRNAPESYLGIGAAGSNVSSGPATAGGKKAGPPTTTTNNPNNLPPKASDQRKRSMELMAKESLKVVKQMTRAVEKNVYEIQESFKLPEKKKDYIPEDEMLRIGYIVFRETRVFTRDVILSSGGGGGGASPSRRRRVRRQESPVQSSFSSSPGTGQTQQQQQQQQQSPQAPLSTNTTTIPNPAEKWSKPIYLKEVAFTGSELCSNASLRDADGMPLIGVSSLKLIDIMTRRALAEMAKTNTGRLLNNAFGEVLNWMDGKGNRAVKP